MAESKQNFVLLAAIGVGAFLLARAVSSAAPVQALSQALTPQAPKEAGVILQGKNYGAFIPFPDFASLFNSLAGTLRSTEDAGEVSVQPGQRMQFLGG